MFVLLRICIGYTNRYEVVSVIPTFVLLCLRIGYTNSYAVVGVMPSLYRPTARLIVDATDI